MDASRRVGPRAPRPKPRRLRFDQLARRLIVPCVAASSCTISCTLTQGDYEPVLAESGLVRPEPGSMPDLSPPESGQGCTVSLECPDGFECAGDVCVPSGCDPAEDVAACVVEVCDGEGCSLASCSDGRQSDAETGVDCGGPCAPCAPEAGCSEDEECAPGGCVEGRCAQPSCDDGLTNQGETGPDCGGAICVPCGVGVGCAADSDCDEGLFCPSVTSLCSPVSCQDTAQNGSERGVDCGGGACPGCAAGATCEAASDCASSSCVGGRCVEPSCDDGVRNAAETDVDCGGVCSACGAGLACTAPVDCASSVCDDAGCAPAAATCCQAPACDDGVRNGSETATDCGAAPCPRCEVGSSCTQGVQCASNVCASGTCGELCDDDVRNGDESAADCGGSEVGCPRCYDGQPCAAESDCASGVCDGAQCVSCTDGIENGDEDGLDCGGSQPGCPACPRCTVDNATDLGSSGTIVSVRADGCARITALPTYSPTRIDSFDDGPYPVPFRWVQECSERSGSGVLAGAFQTVQLDGLSNECPVVFELNGSAEMVNLRWY